MVNKPLIALCVSLLFAVAVARADVVQVKPDHPERYVVVKGDTLWDISARFLADPWRWTEIWEGNPQIANPHLIYPGDVIELVYVEGQPRLRVTRRTADGRPVVRLSPQVREGELDRAIQTIPAGKIRHFLSHNMLVTQEELGAAGYVVGSAGEHVLTGSGDHIYVKKLPGDGQRFTVIQTGQTYKDPDNGEVLGSEAIYKADAQLTRAGQPATLMITRSNREVLKGDYVVPAGSEALERDFQPHTPPERIEARIMAVVDGVSQIGQYQVVALNRGAHDLLQIGHVLEVMRAGEEVADPMSNKEEERIKLPDERAGLVLVFRVFDRVSYALVMNATRAMHVGDHARTP